MDRLVNAVFIIFLTEALHHSTGYRWLPLKSGDPIPEKAVLIDFEYQTYIGRARHYNSMFPAEVYNTTETYALISSCYQKMVKNQFEVLVDMENCCWRSFDLVEEIPANVVRGGTAKNGEPIFIGKSKKLMHNSRWDDGEQMWVSYVEEDRNFRIASILLTSDEMIEWDYNPTSTKFSLVCEDNSTWVDTSSGQIPNNTIYGGRSADGNDIFVARVLNGCTSIPGQVIPKLGIATAAYGDSVIKSPFCQVLVGDSDKYHWVAGKKGEIPEYAIVAGKHGKTELMYVSRVNKTLGYVLHRDLLGSKKPYEILVKSLA